MINLSSIIDKDAPLQNHPQREGSTSARCSARETRRARLVNHAERRAVFLKPLAPAPERSGSLHKTRRGRKKELWLRAERSESHANVKREREREREEGREGGREGGRETRARKKRGGSKETEGWRRRKSEKENETSPSPPPPLPARRGIKESASE